MAVALAGCGYSLRGNLPGHIRSVAVPVFMNRTSEPAVENILTQAVVQAFSTNGRLRVVKPDQADAILEGEVVDYQILALAFDPRANIQQYRLVVTMNLRMRDVRSNTLLFEQPRFQEKSDFRVFGAVSQTISREETALQAAAVDIGRAIVSLAIDRFRSLDSTSFLRLVERGELPPVLLLHGPDSQLLDDALALVADRLFPETASAAFGREVFDGRETDAQTVVTSAMTLPLLGGLRLVIVRHAQALGQRHAEALGAYARDPNPTTRLVLGADNRSVGVNEVDAIVGERRLADVFELTRAVQRRDCVLALKTLERLLTTEEPMRMLALLARDLRMAWTVRTLTEAGQSPGEIARALRLPPAVVGTLGRGDPAARLAEKLARCWDVERRVTACGAPGGEQTGLVAGLCAER